MGELVPFGQPWRMGANEAAAIHLPFAAEVGVVDLEPGSYSIYSVPGDDAGHLVLEWEHTRVEIPIQKKGM